MRAWNRAKLLWGFLAGRSYLSGLPVEYIVETTARCNLHCPMCPREILEQPKEDMPEEIFRRLVCEAGRSAEHMMLVGLGEPFLDPRIFDRIEFCARHNISTLLSTNGTLLDEKTAARVLESPLEHITLSFDAATKENFEFYRKGARFEAVRDNFVRFARMKAERHARLHVVVQMVLLDRNRAEVSDFIRFWRGVPGVDQIRLKEDETLLLAPPGDTNSVAPRHPCHYLWRGPMYVKHNGDVYPCCQSYLLGGQPVGNLGTRSLVEIWNSEAMAQMRRLHARGRAGEIGICSRCRMVLPHPLLVVASLLLHGRTVRRLIPYVERLAYFSRWARGLLQRPAAKPPSKSATPST